MRLIDADKFTQEMKNRQTAVSVSVEHPITDRYFTDKEHWEGVLLAFVEAKLTMDNMPTVDAVPVIRCKDCINWDTEWTTHPPEHYCPAIDQFTSADFYCGYAENKDLEEQHE